VVDPRGNPLGEMSAELRKRSCLRLNVTNTYCLKGYVQMAKFALLVELKAKPGKESEVEAFLEGAVSIVRNEPGTLSWYAAKVEGEAGVYRLFDTFDDQAGVDAHLKGAAAAALMAHAEELFSDAPKIHQLQIFAQK